MPCYNTRYRFILLTSVDLQAAYALQHKASCCNQPRPVENLCFVRLFEDHMDLLNLFEKFQDLRSREEQAESTSLAEHATLVMQTLDQGINSFSDVDKFEVFLTQVGESHRKIAGFRKENFYKIEEPFLYAVRETLQERYTENMDYIYRTSIRFILDTLIKGYEKAEAEEEKEAIAAGAEKPENCEDKKQDNEKKKEDAKKNGDRCPVAHLETQTASAANPPS
ncbi:unnamed protein product [Cyprideis torosa]|uniref:Globin domain-containing protein n=1 Tax=Cyprideis torosa TaxID=163714 RepID=A0A7R8WAV3_9CRUS|nr:unnamed protein product [Cyprideis torosa]CAG0891456.1 unnamed protein product [Cyprideis torosa]